MLRRAVDGDLPRIVDLLHDDRLGAARNPRFADATDAYRQAFARLTDGLDNGEIVAVDRDTVVGCYQLTFIPGLSFTGGERAQIESVRIDAARRGAGLGTRMVLDARRRAAARGCVLLQLTTDISRGRARDFYERLGFVATHHGMKLRLDGSPDQRLG